MLTKQFCNKITKIENSLFQGAIKGHFDLITHSSNFAQTETLANSSPLISTSPDLLFRVISLRALHLFTFVQACASSGGAQIMQAALKLYDLEFAILVKCLDLLRNNHS